MHHGMLGRLGRVLACAAMLATAAVATAGDRIPEQSLATFHQGYQNLIAKAYVPANMDQEIFDNMWRVWEEPLRQQAEQASPEERRRMTLSRYGLTEAPGREGGIPLQYADAGNGHWAINCFSCHGGKVRGQVIPGAPNSHIALQTLFQEIVETKMALGQKVAPEEAAGSLLVPLGGSNGTTNAIIFGVVLGSRRDKDLNVDLNRPMPKLIHNDHDAPAWWNVKYKARLYIDAFAAKSPRAIMQFMQSPENGPEFFHKTEADFVDVLAYIESIEAPKYPFPINAELASAGEKVFSKNCAECHGTYGSNPTYPERIVPIEEIATDRARLDSTPPPLRQGYEESWFSNYGEHKVIADPGGYQAPPLHGIWASAPYLHNGSVPTLYHMLHSSERPVVWHRTEDGYDEQQVGLEVEVLSEIPSTAKSPKQRRHYFDTRMFGKTAVGHTFPDALSEVDKVAVLEYLKTL